MDIFYLIVAGAFFAITAYAVKKAPDFDAGDKP
jgi:hypothetical protein